MRLVLEGPFQKAQQLSWSEIDDIHWEMVNEDGQMLPALFLHFSDPSRLPSDPWSARWVGSHTLMIEASGWARPVEGVVADLRDLREMSTVETMPWE